MMVGLDLACLPEFTGKDHGFPELLPSLYSWQAAFMLAGLLLACSGGESTSTNPSADQSGAASNTADPVVSTAAAASVPVTLEVPQALSAAPFDVERKLSVPPAFGIRLWARVAGARFMALAPNGDVLVSYPAAGKVLLLRERANDLPESFEFASGLQKPHDMVFHTIGATTYLYIAESNRVTRAVYQSGDLQTRARTTVVDNLPDESNTELQGGYAHELKNIAISPDDKLYVSIASSCNACAADRASKGMRAHSAPLGLSFLHKSTVPAAYRRGAVIALHGCWNCSSLQAGYKVVYFPFDLAGNAGDEIDLVTGFVTDAVARAAWGRPVDAIADAKGSLLISDDYAGAIYQLYPKAQ